MEILRYSFLLILSLILTACSGAESSTEIWFTQRDPAGHKIVALNPATRQQKTIIRLKPGEFLSNTGFSPDGTKILYFSHLNESTMEAWLTNSGGSNPLRVLTESNPEGPRAAFFWLDNQRILFCGLKDDWSGHPEDDPWQWKLYDLRSHELRSLIWKGLTIAPPDYWIRSPYQVHIRRIPEESLTEDKLVAFYGHPEVENDVVRVVIDVQVDPSRLPGHLGRTGSATADGRMIAFSGRGGINNNDVFIASDYGHSVQQLTNLQRDYGVSSVGEIAISPNGRWIIFSSSLGLPRAPNLPTEGQDILVSTDGKTLKFLRQDNGSIYGHFVWSADSRYVAVGIVPRGADPNKSSAEVHLIDVETGEIKQLTSDGWSKEVFDWR